MKQKPNVAKGTEVISNKLYELKLLYEDANLNF